MISLNTLLPIFYLQEPQQTQVTKDKEKDLLIILSQISSEIGGWEDEQETDSDHDVEQQYSRDYHECLDDIVCLLVTFLTNESQYVRHSTSNILVAVSNFIAKSRCKWDKFLHKLCVCLEVSMSTILSATSGSSIIESTESDVDSSRHVGKMMVNVNLYTIAGLVRTLRTILKNLKQCPDGELLEIYIKSVDACLTNIPWECMDGIPLVQPSDSQIRSGNDLFCHGKVGSLVSRFVFLGALLQLLCSLIHVITSLEFSTSDKHLDLGKMTNLVPKLLYWCSYQQDRSNRMCISHYLRHKILMLMIRLSFHFHQGTSFFVLWLQLLHEYFEDILHQPITGCHADLDDCLEGSPFLSCVADRQANHRMSNRHLQRQANFLFLKCSFGLINLGKETATNCSCASSNSCLTIQSESDQECCTWKKGSVELSGWLNRHVPLETLVDHGMYLEKCGHFALSFLQLYMDEDDFLFEVLLQLSSLPLPLEQKDFKENNKGFDKLKGDIGFHLNKVFEPVHLFHLFLAERVRDIHFRSPQTSVLWFLLRYDHLILLDYLISKDAGIHCLQYLLRFVPHLLNLKLSALTVLLDAGLI
ncbi:golgin [Thalictrum thalictroides]|uniref:Golgin n=1 Tax=Thalictrum thalictroides TaxID=46969 RepID=A0A7J6W280_THATH|nr:golgin [Thalictrum thalictroides]